MILNIFGPSGSGKTTLIKNLLKNNNLQNFYKSLVKNYVLKKESEFKTSLSLVPLPNYRGTIKEFFEIYGISFDSLFKLNPNIRNLLNTVFLIKNIDDINDVKKRSVETLSAGEIRRFFIIKSLLIESDILVIDEPFSNSDPSLFKLILEALNCSSNVIILSHVPIDDIIKLSGTISININTLRN